MPSESIKHVPECEKICHCKWRQSQRKVGGGAGLIGFLGYVNVRHYHDSELETAGDMDSPVLDSTIVAVTPCLSVGPVDRWPFPAGAYDATFVAWELLRTC